MISKTKEKEKAIRFRKKGFSYSEILKKVPVSKSTLSLWLRSVGLARAQKQRLTKKKLEAAIRGGKTKKDQRIALTKGIKEKANKEIGKLSARELWLIGIALYWAEGSKEKQWNVGVGVRFTNSDPIMLSLFLKWLKDICLVDLRDIKYDLYIHKTADWENARQYWSKILSTSTKKIRVYFKQHKLHTERRNIGKEYHGLIRIHIKKSTNFNRKITGWIEGIYKNSI